MRKRTLGPLPVLVLSLLAVTAAPARAQIPGAERPVGTVMGVPLKDFGTFIAANVIRGNNVNFLHFSQLAVGDFNSQIVSVGVTQRNNGLPAETLYIPTGGTGKVPDIYRQINANDTIIEQTAIGNGNTQVAQVEVDQNNTMTYTPGLTRFMLVPASGFGVIRAANVQANVNQVHIQQTAVGDMNTQVALVSVSQANAANLQIPGESLVSAIANLNKNVIVQTAVGDGNNQVATVSVNQQNVPSLAPANNGGTGGN